MAGEAIGLAYASFQNVDFLSLRITAIYGFGMRSPMYIKPMVENSVLGRPTRFATGGRMKRDYTHVLDCSDGIVAALQVPSWKAGEQRVINVASGNARTAAEVAKIVRATIPGADIEIGDDLTPLEEQNVKMRASLDITAAKRLLNWSPKWPLEAGIAEYAESFRRHVLSPRTRKSCPIFRNTKSTPSVTPRARQNGRTISSAAIPMTADAARLLRVGRNRTGAELCHRHRLHRRNRGQAKARLSALPD